MPLLKAQPHRPATRDAIVLDLGDLGRQAAKLRSHAEAQAETILAEARAEAARLTAGAAEAGERRGYEAGFARGQTDGTQQGRAEAAESFGQQLTELQSSWSAAAQEHDTLAKAARQEATSTALQLAAALAEKVIHRCVEHDHELIVRQVRSALDHVLEPTRVRIHIHPDDRPTLDEVLPAMVKALDVVEHAELVKDATVGRGGCVVQAGPATIDATVQTQLDRLSTLLLGDQKGNPPTTPKAIADAASASSPPDPSEPSDTPDTPDAP
jgi:flagellar assembly protein FliH